MILSRSNENMSNVKLFIQIQKISIFINLVRIWSVYSRDILQKMSWYFSQVFFCEKYMDHVLRRDDDRLI